MTDDIKALADTAKMVIASYEGDGKESWSTPYCEPTITLARGCLELLAHSHVFELWNERTRAYECKCGAQWTEAAMEAQAPALSATFRYRIRALEAERDSARREAEELWGALKCIRSGQDPDNPNTYHDNANRLSCALQDCDCLNEFVRTALARTNPASSPEQESNSD